MGYKSRVIKGVSWLSILRISTRGITFVRLAILARILTPAQFGVFGIASLILALLEILTETGINVFLIQKKEKYAEFIDSAWVVSIIRGCLISLLLIVTAPYVVNFFNSPHSYNVILLISIVPLVRGFVNPSIINIQKEIQFKKEFYIRSTLFLIDALVVIFAAFITKSAESFAYGLIVSATIEVILSFIFFKPWPRISFEPEKIKHIVRKGWWITLTGIFSYFADNSDNIIVGRVLGTSSLGFYQVAYKISTITISEITEVVNKVTFPVYSKIADEKERLFQAFAKIMTISSLVALISGILIFYFSREIVLLILGENWVLIVPIVRILSIYGILRTMFGNFSSLFLSLERQDYVAKMTFVRVFTLFIFLFPLVGAYGLSGAGYAMLISIIAEIPIVFLFTYMIYSKRHS